MAKNNLIPSTSSLKLLKTESENRALIKTANKVDNRAGDRLASVAAVKTSMSKTAES